MNFRGPECATCRDVGIVDLSQNQFKTLALCDCSWGKNQVWKLPAIEIEGYTHSPLAAWEFKPDKQMNYEQKIQWWREKVRTAEKYWETQK